MWLFSHDLFSSNLLGGLQSAFCAFILLSCFYFPLRVLFFWSKCAFSFLYAVLTLLQIVGDKLSFCEETIFICILIFVCL